MADALRQVQGAYSLLFLTPEEHDRRARPAWASGRCAWASCRARDDLRRRQRAVALRSDRRRVRARRRAGRDARDRQHGVRSVWPFAPVKRRRRASSSTSTSRAPTRNIDGVSVYEARKNLGRALAREHGVEADVVIPVPDSGVPAPIGYAEESQPALRARADPQPLRGAHVHRARGRASATSACA